MYEQFISGDGLEEFLDKFLQLCLIQKALELPLLAGGEGRETLCVGRGGQTKNFNPDRLFVYPTKNTPSLSKKTRGILRRIDSARL